MIAELKKIEKLNENIITFWLQPRLKFEYQAGQYSEINLPNETRNSIGDNRWFSLSSSPTENMLAFTTKFIEPFSDFKNTLLKLKIGDEFVVSDAIGDFVLPMDISIPLHFIAGGIGITPVRSIIKYLIDSHEQRNVELNYIVRNNQDLIYDDLLSSYQMKYSKIVGPASETDLFDTLNLNKVDPLYYISGTQAMVESLTNDIRHNIKGSSIVMDYFPGYTNL